MEGIPSSHSIILGTLMMGQLKWIIEKKLNFLGSNSLHIVKEECRHILKPNNEASLNVQSSIQPDGQFIHPVIRLFTATLNLSRHRDGPSFFWVGLFLWQQQR